MTPPSGWIGIRLRLSIWRNGTRDWSYGRARRSSRYDCRDTTHQAHRYQKGRRGGGPKIRHQGRKGNPGAVEKLTQHLARSHCAAGMVPNTLIDVFPPAIVMRPGVLDLTTGLPPAYELAITAPRKVKHSASRVDGAVVSTGDCDGATCAAGHCCTQMYACRGAVPDGALRPLLLPQVYHSVAAEYKDFKITRIRHQSRMA